MNGSHAGDQRLDRLTGLGTLFCFEGVRPKKDKHASIEITEKLFLKGIVEIYNEIDSQNKALKWLE